MFGVVSCIFLMTNDVEHLSCGWFDTYISFGKEPVQILAYIFIGWFVFFFVFNWKIISF